MIEEVVVPTSTTEAVEELRASGGVVLAGGTLLMPTINNQATTHRRLVSTRRANNAMVEHTDGSVRIGAATTLAEVGRSAPLAFLGSALDSIASPTIRSMGTVGGNLFAEQPYGDFAVCLLALRASAEVVNNQGATSRPVDDVVTNGVGEHELVTSVSFDLPAPTSWFYTKAMRRKLNSAAIVTVAAQVDITDGVVASASIGLGGAGPSAQRASAAETTLIGRPLDHESVALAADAASAEANFFTDAYASAWYRKRVFPVHFKRALLGEEVSL